LPIQPSSFSLIHIYEIKFLLQSRYFNINVIILIGLVVLQNKKALAVLNPRFTFSKLLRLNLSVFLVSKRLSGKKNKGASRPT